MMRARGELKVKVLRGVNLAIRDYRTSDPYVVVQYGGTERRTSVTKKNLNPEWHEDLIFYTANPDCLVKIEVFDKDMLSRDDSMGDANIDIQPLIAAANESSENGPDGNIISKVAPSGTNCLAADSTVYWKDGRVVQDVILRLNNVECGEIELELQWARR